ncbi:MAG: sensor histidine kinase [Flaviaesturariibacter sp.]|nr:sensor histidine kinase [Flaviaesturariibacter sp.]
MPSRLALFGLYTAWCLSASAQKSHFYPVRSSSLVGLYGSRIDSLERLLGNACPDTFFIQNSIILAEYCFYSEDVARSDAWLAQAEARCRKTGWKRGALMALRLRGIEEETGHKNYAAALGYFTNAALIAEREGWSAESHAMYTSMLNLCFYTGDFVGAMRIASKGLQLAEKEGAQERVARYDNIIGFIYLRQKNSAGARRFYALYLAAATRRHDTLLIADAQNCLADVCLEEKDDDKALAYLGRAMTVYRGLAAANRLNQMDRLPYTLYKTAFAYGSRGDPVKALGYMQEALRYVETVSCNRYDVAAYFLYAGNLYLQLDRPREALPLLRSGLSIAREIHHKEDLRDAYLYLNQLFARGKKFDSAYAYYLLYDAIRDSISNERTTQQIEEIGNGYSLEKKDRQIERLSQQKRWQEATLRRQLLLRNLSLGFLALAIIIGWLVISRRELKNKQRTQASANQKQHELFNLTAAVQESERKRVAQDLHDGIGTLLSAARLKLSALPDGNNVVAATQRLLDDAISELQSIAHNIMPASLLRLGLVRALQSLFDQLPAGGLHIDYMAYGFDGRLPEEKEIAVYRMILELVNNAIRHSGATVATVQLVRRPGEINILVEDNGCGFEMSRTGNRGIGLRNIGSRVTYLNGSLHIDSRPGHGTTVIIDLPDGAS